MNAASAPSSRTWNGKTEIKVVGTLGTPEALQKFIRSEDWNDYTIVAKGNQVLHFINGHLMSDCVDLGAKAPHEESWHSRSMGLRCRSSSRISVLYRLPDTKPDNGLPLPKSAPAAAKPASTTK